MYLLIMPESVFTWNYGLRRTREWMGKDNRITVWWRSGSLMLEDW